MEALSNILSLEYSAALILYLQSDGDILYTTGRRNMAPTEVANMLAFRTYLRAASS